jgi:hypothetical protein
MFSLLRSSIQLYPWIVPTVICLCNLLVSVHSPCHRLLVACAFALLFYVF